MQNTIFHPDELRVKKPRIERWALEKFRAAVAEATVPDCPGLVRMSGELVELWQAAELEVGHQIDRRGTPAQSIRRGGARRYMNPSCL